MDRVRGLAGGIVAVLNDFDFRPAYKRALGSRPQPMPRAKRKYRARPMTLRSFHGTRLAWRP